MSSTGGAQGQAGEQAGEVDGSRYVVGVDYGTLSARALVVRVSDGAELGSATFDFPHAVMDHTLASSGERLPPEWALQDAADYVEALRQTVPAALEQAGVPASAVIGIATDFTASTPMPVLADGTPLSAVPELESRPHAYVKLWKHHAAQAHADRINALARERDEPWLARYGGFISSEWEFAKALQLLEEDPEVYARTERWVEAADWIVWQLCGSHVRNACTAGYKGIMQDGQMPDRDYLAALNPGFAGFAEEKLQGPIAQLGESAGGLTEQAAGWTGLPAGIPVAVGNVDAHVTAPAARAVEPGQMLAIMGTSTCHVMSSEQLGEVPGMCGVVQGGIVPGLWGYEAGQSGVGDIFAWYVAQQVPGRLEAEAGEAGRSVHEHLTELAREQPVGGHGLLVLDWHNGNRSVLVNTELSGLVVGLSLATRPEDVYRALLEATAFGTREIVEAFVDSGVEVRELVVAGGLLKNTLMMQIYCDVLRMPISTIESDQGPALGAAIHAAVAAGAYPDVLAASEVMGRVTRARYSPDAERADRYDEVFADYRELHDHFGRGGSQVMQRLKRRRREAFGQERGEQV